MIDSCILFVLIRPGANHVIARGGEVTLNDIGKMEKSQNKSVAFA